MSENENKENESLVRQHRRHYYSPFLNLLDDPFFSDHHEDVMRTDIKESDDQFTLKIEIPGIDKKDIKIALEDGELSVSATFDREDREDDDEDGHYIHYERSYGTFKRTFYVGRDIKKSDIKASVNNGILTLAIPKKDEQEEAEDKYITID